jgi:hypothetical protein
VPNYQAAPNQAASNYQAAVSYPDAAVRADSNPYPDSEEHPARDGHGEPLYGGDYAYVIRDGRESAQGQSRLRGQQPAQGPSHHDLGPNGGSRPADPVSAYGPEAPALAYGPDDPGYGPPSADWYARDEEARRQEAEEELRFARGPFEPLPPDHVAPESPVFDHDEDEIGSEADHEVDIALVGQGDGPALERIKDLYQAVETIGDSRLDGHFEQLLERQRQLIREYFTESDSRRSPGFGRAADPSGHPSAPGLDMSEGVGLSLGATPRGRR